MGLIAIYFIVNAFLTCLAGLYVLIGGKFFESAYSKPIYKEGIGFVSCGLITILLFGIIIMLFVCVYNLILWKENKDV